METLRAELARAKEQARSSNVAALKAAEELRAEQAAHCGSRDKMAKMAIELKAAADHCRVLEKENLAKASDLEKATATGKDLRSAMRAKKEELREAGDIVAGKSFMLRRKFGDPRYASLDRRVYGFGGECGGRGCALPKPKGSQDGRAFLVSIPQSGAFTSVDRSVG